MVKNRDPLPPSGRDFEVYRRLHVDGCSDREVAQEARLSQTRVCQIAENVGNYLTTVAPAKEEQPRDKQLVVAERVASLRVEFLYGAAVQSWRGSQGTQTTTRQVATPTQPPVTVSTTRTSLGDGRYLLLAARLAMMSARLPAAGLELHPTAEEGETDEADREYETADSPPIRDCSGKNAPCSPNSDFAGVQPVVTRMTDEVYGQAVVQPPHDRRAFFAPVQQPQSKVERQDVLAFTPAGNLPPLSRRQRRARQKLLEEKLGKG